MVENAPTLSGLSGAIRKLNIVGRVNNRVKANRAFSCLGPLFTIPWEASGCALADKLLDNDTALGKFEGSGGPHPMGNLYNGSGWAASASR